MLGQRSQVRFRQTERRLGMVRLSLDEIQDYVAAGAGARGYVGHVQSVAGRHVRMLEARGLPGFTAFTREVLSSRFETVEQRAHAARPDGANGRSCPMTTPLTDVFGKLRVMDPGQVVLIPAPSNPLLVMPRLADRAALVDKPLMATFYMRDLPQARIVVDGDNVHLDGNVLPLFMAERIGISHFVGNDLTTPPLPTDQVDAIDFPASVLRRLKNMIEFRTSD